ncbi:hypothetical protein BJY01DRAFT_256201 [Aspergillus pseudoustus]|uniref:Zn(2)-C6 fungal-type domain-containing protein n=1 Tax=Aspergillus pseudoustus TaxID=1810923 RepID=A0ABR4ID63_9EURO
MSPNRTKKACINCRQRHVKCDRRQPCTRCSDSNLPCKQPTVHAFCNVSFAGDHSLKVDRASIGLSNADSEERSEKEAVFIDETPSVVNARVDTGSLVDGQLETSNGIDSPPQQLSPSAEFLFNHPPSIVGLPLAAGVHHANLSKTGVGALPINTFPSILDIPDSPIDDTPNIPSTSIINTADLSSEAGPLPCPRVANETASSKQSITHPREAYLLKIFTQTWGPIFDCLDPGLTFTKSAIDIAINEFTPLYWAILATSALQLSRVSNYPLSAAKYYREQCSESVMPILLQSTDPGANEETLFATETLFTSSLAISVKPQGTLSDKVDLGRAAFWVHLRQDIHVALLLQVPIDVDYPPCIQKDQILAGMDYITTTTQPGSSLGKDTIDCAWANRIAVLLVDVINYCFQDSGSRELESWIHIRGRLDHWSAAKPRRFQPYYERPADPASGRVFPDIWIACDCYVLAWMYYHTAKILLKTFPPNHLEALQHHHHSSSSGSSRVPRIESLEDREEVLIHARAICGIAITNPNAQALIVACHMVTISAIFFDTEAERDATIDLLRLAHTVTGHPLTHIEQKLHTCWGRQS